jgi:methyl-CpG-binding domain protein 4
MKASTISIGFLTIPSVSPLNLLQELYRENPWKMLVCCLFLNQTTRKQVDKIREQFFLKYPNPKSLLEHSDEEIENLIQPLGFKKVRTKRLKRFSEEFISIDWKEPIELHGIGKYAQDSWEIFQKFNFNVQPTDGALIDYLNWLEIYKSNVRN